MAEVIQINANTWRFEDDFVRFFLLEGEKQAVMIDSGMNCPDALLQAKKLTDKAIILLNTHGDGDHTSGTASFQEIYMHSLDYTGCELDIMYPDTKLHAVNDGELIDLGGRTLKIIHIPGHTKGSIAILDVNNRALIAGDSVQKGHIYMFGDKREPQKYADSLDKLIAMESEYDVIYASHDEFSVPVGYARKVKEAWLQVQKNELPFEEIDLWGNKVKSYTGADCGFFVIEN